MGRQRKYIIQVWNMEPISNEDAGWITIDTFSETRSNAERIYEHYPETLPNEIFRVIEQASTIKIL